ncbi:MAG: hypothetical protein CVU13_04595 [Bacteroidetes bacterium HGW-Bacteroidetes-8]|jgi:hypothetical protein|nr:MAG: hypothetical protein CVU13_04595 [Bacteroidetes bacterium HGW-Bacteroidetes-8]
MAKKILFVLGALALIVLLFMGGTRLLIRHIYNRTDCERFNIDNIELRTGVDIPDITESKCESDGKIKICEFTLDTNKIVLSHYIDRNKFIQEDSFFVKRGERDDTRYEIKLNPLNAKLFVEIVYKR